MIGVFNQMEHLIKMVSLFFNKMQHGMLPYVSTSHLFTHIFSYLVIYVPTYLPIFFQFGTIYLFTYSTTYILPTYPPT
jgi:hypothetical protein